LLARSSKIDSPCSGIFLTSDGDERPELSSSNLVYRQPRQLDTCNENVVAYLVIFVIEELEEPLPYFRFELIGYDPECKATEQN